VCYFINLLFYILLLHCWQASVCVCGSNSKRFNRLPRGRFWTMANTTTWSYGKIPTLSSDFTTHAMALLRRRHNYSPNSQHAKLDSSLKFKEIRRIKREIYDTFPDVSTSWYYCNFVHDYIKRVWIILLYPCRVYNSVIIVLRNHNSPVRLTLVFSGHTIVRSHRTKNSNVRVTEVLRLCFFTVIKIWRQQKNGQKVRNWVNSIPKCALFIDIKILHSRRVACINY